MQSIKRKSSKLSKEAPKNCRRTDFIAQILQENFRNVTTIFWNIIWMLWTLYGRRSFDLCAGWVTTFRLYITFWQFLSTQRIAEELILLRKFCKKTFETSLRYFRMLFGWYGRYMDVLLTLCAGWVTTFRLYITFCKELRCKFFLEKPTNDFLPLSSVWVDRSPLLFPAGTQRQNNVLITSIPSK